MIHSDDHGNKFIVMADGGHAPLVDASVTIRMDTVLDGQIVQAPIALAVHQTAAAYWYRKYREAETTIADLREQLTARG